VAKVQKFPVGRKPGQRKVELPEEVQVSLAEIAGRTKQGLLAFAVGVGLEVFATLLEEDQTAIVGPKGRHDPDRTCYRHSAEPSSVALGGRRVGVSKPRVRSLSGEEITLPTWAAFAGEELLTEMATERMLAGLSSRHYPVGLEPVGVQGSGTSRSAVSRRFIARTRTALGELMARDLSELRLCAIFGDGLSLADHLIVAAIGVDLQGNKHVLGLKEGSSENATVCKGLLSDLVDRGLDVSGGILLVLDGAKGWAKAVREIFGELALVQRCRLHKQRNVLDYLPDHMHTEVRRKLARAWGQHRYEDALAELTKLAKWLDARGHPSAAGSVREGLEETLTITRLGIPPALSRTLFSTNVVESAFSVARSVMGNVKRWRPRSKSHMIERWCAAGLLVAEGQFRRVNGYKEIPFLVAALKAHAGKMSEAGARVA
jgi:putative transposase